MTVDEHHDLTERLATVADSPAPPTGFDSASAVRQGRARLRRRRRAAVGGVAALTAAVLTGTLLLEPGSDDGPAGSRAPVAPAAAPSATAAPSAGAAITPPTAVPPAGSDPLTSEVRFGWLPAWASDVGYQAGASGLAASAGGKASDSPVIRLSFFPPGPEPEIDLTSTVPQVKSPAPPVDGRTAYWLTRQANGIYNRMLRWQTPSGGWAQLYPYAGGSADHADETVLRIAAGVSFGSWDVPLPLWFSGLPDSFRPQDSSLTRRTNSVLPWFTEIEFQVEGRKVEVTAAPDMELAPGDVQNGPSSPTCRTEHGVKVCAAVSDGGAPAALDQLGGLTGLLGLVGVAGLDESTWTTDVLRR